MPNNNANNQELIRLKFIAEIIAQNSLESLMNIVIRDAPSILKFERCSIYLTKEFVNECTGDLIDGDMSLVSAKDINDEFIVLAKTNNPEKEKYIGKIFYPRGKDLTGWVFKTGAMLHLRDSTDPRELKSIDENLTPSTRYWSIDDDRDQLRPAPVLYVPLKAGHRIIGVLKLHKPLKIEGYSELDEPIAKIIAKAIGDAINQSFELAFQEKTILELVQSSSSHQKEKVVRQVSKSVKDIFNCETAQIFMCSNRENSAIQLCGADGGILADSKPIRRDRNDGLIGWIYKTGKPLIVQDLNTFTPPEYLTDEILKDISNGPPINDSDRKIFCTDSNRPRGNWPVAFIGVPIAQDGEVLGVLSITSRYGEPFKRDTFFINPKDYELLQSFASILTHSIEQEQERILSNLLIELGAKTDLPTLYKMTVDRIPELVSSEGCSIFEYIKSSKGTFLKLVKTSRSKLINKDGSVVELKYLVGEDKTGMAALVKHVFVVNHFGVGEVSEMKIDQEIERINRQYKDDIVERLKDEQGFQVGVLQIWDGKTCSDPVLKKINSLTQLQTFSIDGLPSKKMESLNPNHKNGIWSYVGIPIINSNNLLGVITISRNVPENPFSAHDLHIVQSISGRLGAVIGNITMQEQRTELLMTLAHEINTPITGILAESENILNEALNQPNIKESALDNLTQVQRLQLLTETIMGVLPGRAQVTDFEFVDIGELLNDARNLFLAEARQKRIDIQIPQSIGEKNFPQIEMSKFHLGIAIKNIVHNAVKYSYAGSHTEFTNKAKRRYIKIWGIWQGQDHQKYKISVQNYGVGITPEEIDRRLIFELYYRGEKSTDRRRTGAGFGLSYARNVIEEIHNGRIDVTSIVGEKGDGYQTTFTVTLPVLHSLTK